MQTLLADVRYSLRMMAKSPGFAAVACLTLALAIGANTAIFSFVDGVLLKPLPYPEPETILSLWEKPPGGDRNGISTLNLLDWKEQNTVFSHVAAVSGDQMTLSGTGEPQLLRAQTVGAQYFDLFGTMAARGRTFRPDEDQPGKQFVVVLTHKIWMSRFGGDAAILGRTLTLNNQPYAVIGILPEGSVYDRFWAEIWLPLVLDRATSTRSFHWLSAFARLKPGVSIEQAKSQMNGIAGRIAKDFPESNRDWGITIDRFAERVVGPQLRQSLYVLLAAVGAVLLIGCANMANLMLARAAVRSREVAIRSALGAGRMRLIRQFLTESVLLAVCGGALGLAFGYGLLRAIQISMPPFLLPAQSNVRMDYRILAFTALIAILTGILFGLVPALKSSRDDGSTALKDGGRGSSHGVSHQRFRNSLIAVEVALTFVLLTGAGLLIQSFQKLGSVDPGFDAPNVITMGLPMPMEQNTDGPRLLQYLHRIIEQVRAVPGVKDAAITSALPMQGWGFGMPFQISGKPVVDVSKRQGAFFKMVSPSYFSTLGMRLRRGRLLADSDAMGAAPVAVITETMQKRYFPDEDPIGKRIQIQKIITGKHELGPDIPWEVVGIVADEQTGSPDSPRSPGVYVTLAQSPVVGRGLLVRAAGDPELLVKSIQSAVWAIKKDQALTNIRTIEQIKTEQMASNRLRTILLGVFAGIALALAAVGVYGVISYSVAQRTHEMGIRSALGAGAGDLLALVLRGGMIVTLAGLALGLAGSFGLTRLLATLLFQTNPNDPGTLAGVAGGLAAVALLACLIPARRATRVDPIVALRCD